MTPSVSVIVPTHNRATMLHAQLEALAAQTYARERMEWIVVCDGCDDDSAQVAVRGGADRVIEQWNAGASTARNAGLDAASADFVLFLDDDVIATPRWAQALVEAMAVRSEHVLYMGYCPFAPAVIRTPLDRRNADWYEGKVRALANSGHRWQFTDFFGGNFGAARQPLQALGGFDARLRLFEDAELAFRALEAGWQIAFVPAARALHHWQRSLDQYATQAYRSGQADAVFASIHPRAAGQLRIGMRRRGLRRAAGDAWRHLCRGSGLPLHAVERMAHFAVRLRLDAVLNLIYALIWDGHYWRGAAPTLPSPGGGGRLR